MFRASASGHEQKRVDDVAEAEWVQSLLDRVEPDGFAVAAPVATLDNRWAHSGWTASCFIPGLRAAAPAWPDIIDAGLRFGDAAERARDGGAEVLSRRVHRWAIADRAAWGEQRVELPHTSEDLFAHISQWTTQATHEEHFVHGDLSGNVFFDTANEPVVLDVSPYLRPREWAAAVVVADAVLWSDADLDLVRTYVADPRTADLFARALLFRLVAGQLTDVPGGREPLEPYRAAISVLR